MTHPIDFEAPFERAAILARHLITGGFTATVDNMGNGCFSAGVRYAYQGRPRVMHLAWDGMLLWQLDCGTCGETLSDAELSDPPEAVATKVWELFEEDDPGVTWTGPETLPADTYEPGATCPHHR
ncbi:hypothetical protein ACFW1A_21580 [Kitasatospora sp. NPDC058965]|uniref:hypothetical protein n=1 Tax=Kitasatospora sp. NPDC058965 TaxID=3346682 RepID=UPI00368A0CFD